MEHEMGVAEKVENSGKTNRDFFFEKIDFKHIEQSAFGILLPIFACAILSLAISFMSCSCPFAVSDAGDDSHVFKYIGHIMTLGFVPYVDTFDHKGPVLYLINYLGSLINTYWGVWFFELLAIFLVHILSYRYARRYLGKIASVLLLLLISASYYEFYDCGNYTENYALPAIIGSLIIFRDYFAEHTITKLRLILCGFTFAWVLMLQPNMIALWITGCLFVLIDACRRKELNRVPGFILYFIIGAAILILPILIRLGSKGALKEFFQCYIGFNFIYTHSDSWVTAADIRDTLFYFLCKSYLLLSLFFIAIRVAMKRSTCSVFFLVYSLLSMYLMALSGHQWVHYTCPFFSIYLCGFTVLFNWFKTSKHKLVRRCVLICTAIFFLCIPLMHYISLGRTVLSALSSFQNAESKVSTTIMDVCKLIDQYTDETDCIAVYGNRSEFYLFSNRLSATYYSYTAPIFDIDSTLSDIYFEEFESNPPAAIVTTISTDRMTEFCSSHHYQIVYNAEDIVLYLSPDSLSSTD